MNAHTHRLPVQAGGVGVRIGSACGSTQASVAALLRVDPQTISRRERGEIPITHEAALALFSLPKKRSPVGRRTPRMSHGHSGPLALADC